jgi:hypothetical protein
MKNLIKNGIKSKATHLCQVRFPAFVLDKFTSGLYVGITNVFLRQTIYVIDNFFLFVYEAEIYSPSFICVYSEVRQTFQ